MEKIWEYTIKLLRYVLNGDIPKLPENIDFEQLFAFGESHGVENMLYVGLRDLKINVPPDTMAKFEEAHDMAIMIEATQALELEAISEAFEKAGIDFVPLKGSVVKYLYPMPDYRQSGDIDILIREEDMETADKALNERGYLIDTVHNKHEMHTTYIKAPFIQVELHKKLARYNDRSRKLFENVWNDLINKNSHIYIMNNEYLYCFLMAHLCKHLQLGGAGIRMILDIYILRNNIVLYNDVLEVYLRKSNLLDLNKMVTALIDIWFRDEYIEDKDARVLGYYIMKNGSFGNVEMRDVMLSTDSVGNKLKKYIRRLFPPVRTLKNRYGFLEKKPYLLPIMWIYRIIYMGLCERENINIKNKEILGSGNKRKELQNIVKAVRDI